MIAKEGQMGRRKNVDCSLLDYRRGLLRKLTLVKVIITER
jgi:hypothetical protein